MPRTFVAVMVLKQWEGLTTAPFGYNLACPATFGIGFCPVFETEEEARSQYPGAKLMHLNEVVEEESHETVTL